ncbi:hypothetical protein RYZ26_17215 [Terasakiella sp. A23]|uniref:hypothetical protein n=1 Tax=Terasakiella sp. FCG-A23 TaxID=3080561 RepID=UPI00295340D0|nr:hypothetical protein [Terasakiella sp. A23]MDV7341352.1 hypothetical protein [Terasakiella sp. A23]
MTSNNILKESDYCKKKNQIISKELYWKFIDVNNAVNSDLDIAKQLEYRDKHRKLEKDTQEIARKLQLAGYNPYYGEPKTKVNPVTLETETKFSYRNLMILPEIAYRHNADIRNKLELFVIEHGIKQLKQHMISFEVLNPSDYYDHHRVFTKKLSKFREFAKNNGIEYLYQRIETPDFKKKDGNCAINLHAHLIGQVISKPNFEAINKYVRKHFRFFGDIENVKSSEITKTIRYVTKTENHVDMPSVDLAEFAKQIENLKFSFPVGSFRKYVSELNRDNERVAKVGERLEKLKRYERTRNPHKKSKDSANRILRISRPTYCGTDYKRFPCLIVDKFTSVAEFLECEHNRKLVNKIRRAFNLPDVDYKAIDTGNTLDNNQEDYKTSNPAIPISEIWDEIPF